VFDLDFSVEHRGSEPRTLACQEQAVADSGTHRLTFKVECLSDHCRPGTCNVLVIECLFGVPLWPPPGPKPALAALPSRRSRTHGPLPVTYAGEHEELAAQVVGTELPSPTYADRRRAVLWTFAPP
jgi:hypothetical protein